MTSFKSLTIFILIMFLFSSCSSAQKLQAKAPVALGDVYCQKWVAGVKDGGSGINLFIPISNSIPINIQLDSVYFRGKGAKLEKIEPQNTMYVGRFNTDFNSKQDIVMSTDMNEEYGNEAPDLSKKVPFELEDSECVISYKEGKDTKYYKIEAITEKPAQNYPSAPPNRQ